MAKDKPKEGSSWSAKEQGGKGQKGDYLQKLGQAEYNINVDHGARQMMLVQCPAHMHAGCIVPGQSLARQHEYWTASYSHYDHAQQWLAKPLHQALRASNGSPAATCTIFWLASDMLPL